MWGYDAAITCDMYLSCSDLAGPGDAEERRPEELPAVYEDWQ